MQSHMNCMASLSVLCLVCVDGAVYRVLCTQCYVYSYANTLPGRRRIELFGTQHNVRPGWVTVGAALPPSNFNPQLYAANFINPNGMPCVGHDGTKPVPGSVSLVGTIPEVEALRPRGDQSAKPT